MSKPLINRCFIHIVAVMFLALGSSIAFANDFQAFAESLEGRGWQVQKDASGSLLLFPTAGQHATRDSRITDKNTDLDALAERLAASGWQVKRDVDSSVVFRAADKTHQQPATVAQPRPDMDLNALGDRLAASGWQVARGADGSITFWTADKPDHGPAIAAQQPATSAGPVDLGDRLAASGWQVARGADGSTTFWADHKHGNTLTTAFDLRPITRFENLRERLDARGWQVEHGGDGSIIVWAASITPRPYWNS
jgi:hypothetical protein